MTWTHFTSYLTGTRFITKDERDELYDNLAALLAGDCSYGGYSLNSTELTAVKGSGLLTDRARLDGPSSSVTRDRIEALISTASGVFANYSAARTAALSGESISSSDLTAILGSGLDSYHLWNYYKRLIDGLQCCPVTVKDMAGIGGGVCNRTGGTVLSSYQNCCPWEISDSGGGSGGTYTARDRYYDFPAIPTGGKSLHLVYDFLSPIPNQLALSAWNGSGCTSLYLTDCITGSGSATLTVPAGTTRIVVTIIGSCDGNPGDDLWSLVLTCP